MWDLKELRIARDCIVGRKNGIIRNKLEGLLDINFKIERTDMLIHNDGELCDFLLIPTRI